MYSYVHPTFGSLSQVQLLSSCPPSSPNDRCESPVTTRERGLGTRMARVSKNTMQLDALIIDP
jgi:hypothetical protein